MSLSLALGILVSDLRGYRLLTSAHAQEAGQCGGPGNEGTITSDTVNIEDGTILSGIVVRNVNVNGSVVEQAFIAGTVQLSGATVAGSNSIIYGGQDGVLVGSGSPCTDGVLVGSGSPASSGVLVGSGSPAPSGVLVGSGSPAPSGVLVGSGSPVTTVSGVIGSAVGAAVGGSLTGDGITINDGVVTGQNLLLSGTTFDNGSISGTINSISIKPAS